MAFSEGLKFWCLLLEMTWRKAESSDAKYNLGLCHLHVRQNNLAGPRTVPQQRYKDPSPNGRLICLCLANWYALPGQYHKPQCYSGVRWHRNRPYPAQLYFKKIWLHSCKNMIVFLKLSGIRRVRDVTTIVAWNVQKCIDWKAWMSPKHKKMGIARSTVLGRIIMMPDKNRNMVFPMGFHILLQSTKHTEKSAVKTFRAEGFPMEW